MPIRLSGMNSGLDTDAIVKELVNAYSIKTQKYEKQKTKIEWKKDAWQSLNTKIYGLYTNISNLRFGDAYNLKKTSVSDPTKAKVTASSNAVAGTQKLHVLATAQVSYITGGKIGDDVTSSSTLADLGYDKEDTSIEVRTKSGAVKEISITKDTKISDVVKQLQDAGLNASFDETNKRFFISAKESGAANDFDLCATDSNSQEVLSKLGLNLSILEYDSNGKKTFSSAGGAYKEAYDLYNASNNGDIDSYLRDFVKNYNEELKKQEDIIKDNKDTITAYKDIENQIKVRSAYEAYDAIKSALTTKGVDSDKVGSLIEAFKSEEITEAKVKEVLGLGEDESAQEIVKALTENKENIKTVTAYEGYGTVKTAYDAIKSALTEKGVASDKVGSLIEAFKSEEITEAKVKEVLGLGEDESAEEIVNALTENKDNIKTVNDSEAGVPTKTVKELNADKVAAQEAYDAAVKATDDANAAITKLNKFEDAEINATDCAKLVKMGEAELAKAITDYKERAKEAIDILAGTKPTEGGATKIAGQDAKIVLNGAEFTSSSNSFSVNGLTIEAQAVTTEELSITTAVDTQGIYDKVKDFLTQYNNVINEITKLYNADAAKGYEPLTDEEREEMSEKEIEKWEDKIKSSILRRDSSLGSIMNAMVNSMSKSYEVNGQMLSLGSFGISTLGFLNAAENEQYAFHIDGDEDDEKTAGKTDKLMAAIQENPDQIVEFMKKLTSNLYSEVDKKMKSTELSSVYKVYNDKEIDKEIKNIEDLIKKWEEKVEAEEERYYKQFSNMEVALSKMQSQTNALAGLLGQ